jgi:hypothetical protein
MPCHPRMLSGGRSGSVPAVNDAMQGGPAAWYQITA